jgi:hypothetical protein
MIEMPSMQTINPKTLNMFMIETRKVNKVFKKPLQPTLFLGNITNSSQGYLRTHPYA